MWCYHYLKEVETEVGEIVYAIIRIFPEINPYKYASVRPLVNLCAVAGPMGGGGGGGGSTLRPRFWTMLFLSLLENFKLFSKPQVIIEI